MGINHRGMGREQFRDSFQGERHIPVYYSLTVNTMRRKAARPSTICCTRRAVHLVEKLLNGKFCLQFSSNLGTELDKRTTVATTDRIGFLRLRRL